MILYQGSVSSEATTSYNLAGTANLGRLQTAIIASEPNFRRWQVRSLPDDLHALRAQALRFGADSISSPLASAPSRDLMPLAWTESTLAQVCCQVRHVQLCLEPIAYFVSTIASLTRAPSEMSEAEFVSRLLTRTGCGWSVNLTSVYANSVNFRFNAYEFLAEVLPAAPRLQVEISGGYVDASTGLYLCDHEQAIPEAAWELLQFVQIQAARKLEAVFAPPTSADAIQSRLNRYSQPLLALQN